MSSIEDESALPYEKRHESNTLLEKAPAKSERAIESAVQLVLERATFLDYHPEPGHRMLDFGCGVGHSVRNLVEAHQLDAYGVDVYEFWGAEHEHYYEQSPVPPPAIAERLHKLHAPDYRIPFPDNHFDLVFSNQVFEHIADRRPAFAEISRVTKPDGLALQIFPGPWKLREPHIGLPLIPLCHSRWYLTLWAMAGFRTARQKHLSWRETVAANLDTMQYCHYPYQERLIGDAAEVGVDIEFVQGDWLNQEDKRLTRVFSVARRLGAGGLVTAVLGAMAERMMVIKPS